MRGTLNQPQDTDQGWTVELAIPLRTLRIGYPFRVPAEDTLWQLNFSCVELNPGYSRNGQLTKQQAAGHDRSEHNWVSRAN